MRWKPYELNLTDYHKVIVAEGESDRNFFKAFCTANNIDGFDFAFTGMHTSSPYNPSGFSEFGRYLPVLETQRNFQAVTDIVLVCDSTDNAPGQLTALRRQIRNANRAIGRTVYDETPAMNVVATNGTPRVHVLTVPVGSAGGLETVCVRVARDHRNDGGGNGTALEGHVNVFANSVCNAWTTEKRDKLRLQTFISAAWDSKPDLHFSQLFDITRGNLVPLTGAAFADVRGFLTQVSAL